jgi:anaerobic selenocysteine-containing dehydrogenase
MSVSRRNFLKGAAAGSAGTALAGGVCTVIENEDVGVIGGEDVRA